jgi:hypothetical protein
LSSVALAALFLGAVEFAFAHGLILPVPAPIVGLCSRNRWSDRM